MMKYVLAAVQISLCDDPGLEVSAARQCLGIEVVVGDTQVSYK